MGGTHVFSDLWFHFNWHCKDDTPLISPEIEPALFGFIEDYCRKTKGAHFESVGGTEAHVHLLLSIEPFVTLSDFIGKLKGASAHDMNVRFASGSLHWQRGYGVVSFARSNLDAMRGYVRDQKEHHRHRTFKDVLERHNADDE